MEIQADHVPMVTVLNKIDKLNDPEKARQSLEMFSRAVAISALKGEGINDLLSVVGRQLYETYQPISVRLPYQEGGLISMFHDYGQVERIEHQRSWVFIQGRLPGRLLAQYQLYTHWESEQEPGSDGNVIDGIDPDLEL